MNEAKRPLKVFLSYASQDRPLVRELSRRLVSEGWIETWFDEKSLLPGQDWRLKIEEAVEESDIVIICLSNNSVTKEGYVQKELRYAREIALEKLEEAIFLIPLRLDECEVPRGLRFYQWVDYFGEKKDESYGALAESLKLRYEQKLRLEEAERARKEKLEAERIAREEVTREKARRDAEEKARLEAEERARLKAEKEIVEKDAREKAEKEATEKAARLKADEEERQQIAREKAEREKAKREAAEMTKREREEQRAAQFATLKEAISNFKVSLRSNLTKTIPLLRIGGIAAITIALFWISSWGIPKLASFVPTAKASVTPGMNVTMTSPNSPVSFTKTAELTPTFTKAITPMPSEPFPYIIQEGDTLQNIADKFNLGQDGVLLILEFNSDIMKNNGIYYVGQTLTIPPPGTELNTPTPIPNLAKGTKIEYQVLPGDTLEGISAKFNSRAEDIIALNNINPNEITVGQTLQIPVNLIMATATLPPTSTALPTEIMDAQGVSMVLVPAGEFIMGSTADAAFAECLKQNPDDCARNLLIDEEPPHQVYLESFYMDKYEVTNAAYGRCVDAGVCIPPKSSTSHTHTTYYGNSEFDEYPVIYVDWNMAKTYCEWRDSDLPTEAQWEKAARGMDDRMYPWGEGIGCDKANYNNCKGDTTKVGSYLDGVSPFGLYDMAGNVREWVNDWYDANYYQNSPPSDPLGPISGQYRVLRGGSWNGPDYYALSAYRYYGGAPGLIYNYVGFRCAKDAIP